MPSAALRNYDEFTSASITYDHGGAARTQPPLPPGVVSAARLEIRPPAALASTGIPSLDALAGGLPRGALTEIFGPASSGRTSLIMAALAEATTRQEVCALVDAGDSFDPASAAAAGVDLRRVLWIRCGQAPQLNKAGLAHCSTAQAGQQKMETRKFRPLEHVLRTTDLLLQSSGFGVVIVDLGDVPPAMARRIPLTSWFRFRRAVENTPTVLLVIEQEPYAKTCASLILRLEAHPFATAPADATRCSPAQQLFSEARRSHYSPSVRNIAHPGFPNPQCYPDFERVLRAPAKVAPGEILEFPRDVMHRRHTTMAVPEPRAAGEQHRATAFRQADEMTCRPASCTPTHAQLLRELPIGVELVHARGQKKPAHSSIAFQTRTAWA
jgi:hypothetical protein